MKIKSWIAALCALLLCISSLPALALSERSFSEDMANLGKAIEESVKDFSDELTQFGSNPYDYIKENEVIEGILDQGWSAMEKLDEYLTGEEFDSFMKYVFAAVTEQIAKVDLKAIQDMAWETGEEFAEHWPVFKASVKGAVEAALDSDLTWEEKRESIRQYGVLAIPYLAQVDLEAAGDNARAALESLKELIPADTDEQVKAWLEENRQRIEELRAYLES